MGQQKGVKEPLSMGQRNRLTGNQDSQYYPPHCAAESIGSFASSPLPSFLLSEAGCGTNCADQDTEHRERYIALETLQIRGRRSKHSASVISGQCRKILCASTQM
ncbi:Hypothetical predicted protein [Pelobates cultripes]|uniref:Uncharacterized protein n=1 Tax=Pelobates cultripes TaxID=61616 RepID=A0AAD1SGS2_PELCU|nr:Hypothetical predicted protein [Pelobates cultripes]